MQTIEKNRTVNVGADKVLAVLTDPVLEVERNKRVNEAVDCEYKEEEENDEQLIYELHCTEYARGIKGINKSKTEVNIYKYTWNLKEKFAKWEYHLSSWKNKVKVNGTVNLKDNGDSTDIINKINISIGIPLVGKKIEKMIKKEISDSWHLYDEYIDDKLGK
jgi:hypothetical protein